MTTRRPRQRTSRPARARRALAAVAVAAFAVTACGQFEAGSSGGGGKGPFYAGKKVEILVPFDTGGGTDTTARFLAPFLTKYVAGEPSVQVVNVPGGGGVAGSNEFAQRRKHDGNTLFLSSGSTTFPYLLGQEGVKYDYKKFKPTLAMPTGGAIYISPKTGVKKAEDLADFDKQLYIGGKAPTAIDAVFLVAWDLLGLDVKTIFGYQGSGPQRAAFEQGETNMDWQTTSAYKASVEPLVKAGKANPLFTVGQIRDGKLVRDPAFPDLPHIGEVYEMLHGKPPSGTQWEVYKSLVATAFSLQKVLWLHEDAPPEAAKAIRTAGTEMVKDKKFRAKKEEVLAGYDLVTGKDLTTQVKDAVNIPDKRLEWTIDFLNKNYDTDL